MVSGQSSRERVRNAANGLATGHGAIRTRLHVAAATLVPLRPEDFPEGEPRQRFSDIYEDLTGASIAVSVALLTDDKARALATQIFDLFVTVNDPSDDR
jgi:hypothetical protein